MDADSRNFEIAQKNLTKTTGRFRELKEACLSGNVRMIRAFCINFKEFLNCTDEDGFTSLY